MYHRDRNSFKILKFFIYLNDVDRDCGPFSYIEKSHINWPFLSNKQYRWKDENIFNLMPKANTFYATGNLGDLIIADTTGFHKGNNFNKGFRTMLTVMYCIHTNDDKGSKYLNIRNLNEYSFKLDNEQKNCLKYCNYLKT